MSDAAKFPQPQEADSEDVSWALSTGQAMWSRGDTAEAIRWVKRASESAADAGDDDRALALARVAADLKVLTGGSVMPPAPPPEPAPRPATAAPPPPARSSTATPPPPAVRQTTGAPASPTKSQTGAPPRQTGAPPPARGSAPMPTAGRVAPATSPKIPLPTAGTRQPLSPAKRPAPTPTPARAVPMPATAHAHGAPPPPPPSDRDTAIPGDTPEPGEEVFPRHEAPTAGGSSAPPPARAQMPTPTEVFSTVVPREAFADHDDHGADDASDHDEEPSAADDGPTAAVSFAALEPRAAPAATDAATHSAPAIASSPVWLVRHDGELRVVVANGARPDGAIDAVLVASAADLASALRA